MGAEFGKDPLKPYAYGFAGLAMMLNIRLVYSAAPYALLRFKLPENLFSVFVRIMAGSLELWCLPSMVIGNIMDFARKASNKKWYEWGYHGQSIFWSWANFVTFVILWISFIIGGDQGNVTAFYWVIAASGFVFGINMVMVYALEFQYLSWYMIGENSFPMVTSLMHYVGTLIFGNRRKWNSDYIIVTIDIIISLAISLVAAALWTKAYYKGEEAKDDDPPWATASSDEHHHTCNDAPSPHLAATNGTCDYYAHFIPPSIMVLVGMGLVYSIYPGIAPGMIVPFYLIDKIEMVLLIATAFPPVIIGILKQHDINPYVPMGNWGGKHEAVTGPSDNSESHSNHPDNCCIRGKQYTWTPETLWYWHIFTILAPLKICLAAIFIYSLHYPDSSLSRSIVNQPKMSTALSIIFYMCHEILLAMGFPGISSDDNILLPIQLVGAFLMVLLAFYSVGYITEYKRHDASQWPTDGMTTWNALCYWLKMASKITNKNFKQLFTTDLRRDLLLCIQKNELI